MGPELPNPNHMSFSRTKHVTIENMAVDVLHELVEIAKRHLEAVYSDPNMGEEHLRCAMYSIVDSLVLDFIEELLKQKVNHWWSMHNELKRYVEELKSRG